MYDAATSINRDVVPGIFEATGGRAIEEPITCDAVVGRGIHAKAHAVRPHLFFHQSRLSDARCGSQENQHQSYPHTITSANIMNPKKLSYHLLITGLPKISWMGGDPRVLQSSSNCEMIKILISPSLQAK